MMFYLWRVRFAIHQFVGNLEDTAAFALALTVLSLTGVNT
jgi:hypothetical protein